MHIMYVIIITYISIEYRSLQPGQFIKKYHGFTLSATVLLSAKCPPAIPRHAHYAVAARTDFFVRNVARRRRSFRGLKISSERMCMLILLDFLGRGFCLSAKRCRSVARTKKVAACSHDISKWWQNAVGGYCHLWCYVPYRLSNDTAVSRGNGTLYVYHL